MTVYRNKGSRTMNYKMILQCIGAYVVGKFFLGVIFSLAGQIPAVKVFKQKQAQEAQIVYEARQKVAKEYVKSQFTLEPLQSKYGSLLNTYHFMQFPTSEVGMPMYYNSFAYDSEISCHWAKKVWSVFAKEELSCSSPKNS